MFFDENIVATNQTFSSKEDAINTMSCKALKANKLKACGDYIHSVYEREAEYSTAIGYGVAIPHGCSNDVIESFVAVATLESPLKWDEDLVDMIFMIGVKPNHRNQDHLKILSSLSRHLVHEEFRKEVKLARNNIELMQILNQIEDEL